MRVLPRRPQGATQLYVAWVSPFVKKHEEGIDRALEEGIRKGTEGMNLIRSRVSGLSAGAYVRGAAANAAPAGVAHQASRGANGSASSLHGK